MKHKPLPRLYCEIIRHVLHELRHNPLRVLDNKGNQHHLTEMSVATGRNLIKFGARSLSSPTVDSSNEGKGSVNDASWNLKGVRFAFPGPVNEVNALTLPNAPSLDDPTKFVRDMIQQLKVLRMKYTSSSSRASR